MLSYIVSASDILASVSWQSGMKLIIPHISNEIFYMDHQLKLPDKNKISKLYVRTVVTPDFHIAEQSRLTR